MRRYLVSAIEQALWSALNLGVNLILIRLAAPAAFGAFAFWMACAFVISSIQNAVSVCHLQVLAPGDGLAPNRLPVERLMHRVTAVYVVVCGLGVALVVALFARTAPGLADWGAAAFVPAFLAQQYARSLAFTRGQPTVAAIQTGAVSALSGVLLIPAWIVAGVNAETTLFALAGAYAVVAIVSLARATRGQFAGTSWRELRGYGAYARLSAWVFLGVSTTELQARFYAFATTAFLGPAGLAPLAATQQFQRPVALVASSWSQVARADLAGKRDHADLAGFRRVLAWTVVGGSVAAAGWGAMVWLGWPWLSRVLFAGRYLSEGVLVGLWGIAGAIGFGQTVASAGLQALKAFKALAIINAIASAAAAGAILLLLPRLGGAGAIMGTSVGQALELILMAGLLMRRLAAGLSA